jgi:peptide/nickel transport system substrate-binding protein
VEGFSTPDKRSGRLVLEANTRYWDKGRSARIKRIVFDNTLSQKQAVELVKSGAGRVDLVTELSPLETLRVAESGLATVVKNRESRMSVFGRYNMLKTGSPWTDIRLRQAANLAINRADLIQYGANGNGLIMPALVPGIRDPGIAPYPFDPGRARDILREAGYPGGLGITLIAPQDLHTQGTVVSNMLDQAGFKTTLQILDVTVYTQKTLLSHLDQPAEKQSWDIALTQSGDGMSFPLFDLYQWYVIDGVEDWVVEQPELRRLYDLALRTVDHGNQEDVLRQMERHTHEQAYFLFLYHPIRLYAVNRNVRFAPYAISWTRLADSSVTDHHWSVRKKNGQK